LHTSAQNGEVEARDQSDGGVVILGVKTTTEVRARGGAAGSARSKDRKRIRNRDACSTTKSAWVEEASWAQMVVAGGTFRIGW